MSTSRETAVTAGMGIAAAALVAAAIAFTPRPLPPDTFKDEGEPLFPAFVDPHQAASIEITDFDDATATVRPFKVERRDGRWVLPSHQDYPAEAEDRLVKVSAALGTLKKGPLRSDRDEDHPVLGVVDPLDEKAASLQGRGRRAVLRDAGGKVLADAIVGKAVEGRDGSRYVRLTGAKRTHAVSMKDVELSSDFYDWIERDLLKVDRHRLKRIELDHYRIDEQRGALIPGDKVVLVKPESGDWTIEGLPEGQSVSREKVDGILAALDDLKINSVHRKPPGLTRDLVRDGGIRLEDTTLRDLVSRGFFFTGENQLVSNDGEVRVWTDQGVRYVLRFGELAMGATGKEEGRWLFLTANFDPAALPEPPKPAPPGGEKPPGEGAVAPGGDGTKPPGGEKPPDAPPGGDKPPDAPPGETPPPGGEPPKSAGENIAQDPPAGGDAPPAGQEPPKPDAPKPDAPAVPALPQEPAKPEPVKPPAPVVDDTAQREWEQKHDDWKKKRDEGQKAANELTARFADWYYVIPAETFKSIRLTRAELQKPAAPGGH